VEGCRLLLDVGHGSGWHLMNMAVVEAIQRREEARSHAEEALCIGQRTGSTFLIACAERTLGFLDLTQVNMNGARCEALFCSWLQLSDAPTADMVTTAISRAVQRCIEAIDGEERSACAAGPGDRLARPGGRLGCPTGGPACRHSAGG